MPISNNLKVLFDKHNLPTENADIYWSQVDDGWIPLIDKLITDLLAMGWDGDAHQIKEKFGTLRFRVHGKLSEALRAEILKAEEVDSAHICEQCGAPGHLRSDPWQRTWCDACEAAHD